jgi:hypothetical protein
LQIAERAGVSARGFRDRGFDVKPIIAIAIQTVRASIRSRVFHTLGLLILVAVLVLPTLVSGTGTAMSQLQISLTYSLGVVTALVSLSALWLACSSLAHEIEAYQIHLVLTKPASRWAVWLGKWLGVFAMHAVIFLVAALLVLVLIQWRLRTGDFDPDELARLRREILVGRKAYIPRPPDFRAMADEEYKRRRDQLAADHNPGYIRAELTRQIRANYMEVQYGQVREWTFRGIRARPDQTLFLRWRCYRNSLNSQNQALTMGVWGIYDPEADTAEKFVYAAPQTEMSAFFHELPIPSRYVTEDGTVTLRYVNLDPEEKVVLFQFADGPQLLVPATGFTGNYLRASMLVLLQLVFLTALGCALGALLSPPVAVFVALAYLALGMTAKSVIGSIPLNDLGAFAYTNIFDVIGHTIARGVKVLVVSVDDFRATLDLARGHLIGMPRIAIAFVMLVVLRGLPLALLGVWLFTRRELGTVTRR